MKHSILILNFLVILSLSGNVQAANDTRFDAYGWLWAKNYTKAVESFTVVINQGTTADVDDLFHRGLANYKAEKYTQALADFSLAAEKGKFDAKLWEARCYSQAAELNKALNSLRSYLQNAEAPKVDEIRKDPLFKAMHASEKWFLLWQNNWGGPNQETMVAAERYINRYNYGEAHRIIDEAISEKGPNAELHALNAAVYSREDLPALAINELNYALEFEPANTAYLMQKAELLIEREQYDEAKESLIQILDLTPYNFDARVELAKVLYKLQDYQLAKDQLQVLLKYSSAPELVYLAGQTDFELGNYTSVLKAMNPLLEQDQSESGYFKLRGQTYYKTHLYKQAAYDLSMSLDLDPFDAEVNYTLGLTQKALNDASMACYYMQKAANLGHFDAQQFISDSCNTLDLKTKKGTF